jgi:hypothetical protein
VTPEVEAAIAEIRRGLPDAEVVASDDGQGGAVVFVDGIPLGVPYIQDDTWFGFRIPFNIPYADVYPHFARGDLARIDGRPLGEATSASSFEGRSAIQISRRSNRRSERETPLLKLVKVIEWLRKRP